MRVISSRITVWSEYPGTPAQQTRTSICPISFKLYSISPGTLLASNVRLNGEGLRPIPISRQHPFRPRSDSGAHNDVSPSRARQRQIPSPMRHHRPSHRTGLQSHLHPSRSHLSPFSSLHGFCRNMKYGFSEEGRGGRWKRFKAETFNRLDQSPNHMKTFDSEPTMLSHT